MALNKSSNDTSESKRFLGRDETLASWERKSSGGNRKVVDRKTQTISFGSTRYECRKLELLVHSKDLDTADENSKFIGRVLETRVRQQLQKLRKVAQKEADGIQIIRGCLNTIVMMESGGRFESVKNAIDEFSRELSAASESTDVGAEENYIKRQAILFKQSFDDLCRDYLNKYVLFHEGKVLFSADSINEVAKVAYAKRKAKDIFIKKVVSVRDTIEIVTPIVIENTELA